MSRSCIYIWEYGAGLGHLLGFIPIAQTLRQSGYDVLFFIPRKAVNIDSCVDILRTLEFRYVFNPGSHIRGVRAKKVETYVDLVSELESFSTPSNSYFYLSAWDLILSEYSPSIVVGDFALLPLLVAKIKKIPTVAIDSGYFYPDPRSEHYIFPDVTMDKQSLSKLVLKEETFSKRLDDCISDVFKGETFSQFKDIYNSDMMLFLNSPQLSPVPHVSSDDFLGGISVDYSYSEKFSSLTFSKESRPKIFAYLYLSTVHAFNILATLREKKEFEILIYAPEYDNQINVDSLGEHIQILDMPANLDQVLPCADLVICHAGANMIRQSLSYGKPLLLAPFHHEQKLNSDRVSAIGAGISLSDFNYEPQTISNTLDLLLSNPMYTAKARAFQYSYKPADVDWISKRVEKLVSERQSSVVRTITSVEKTSRKPINFCDLPIVFLSYDEPNAEENWSKLKALAPGAKRVHGVHGFDAAHKEAAKVAGSNRFILIDGDNQLDPNFLDVSTTVPIEFCHSIWQWCSRNSVNNLIYASGGIKIWTRAGIEKIDSHESASANSSLSLDFWDQAAYCVFKNVYSTTYINGSPFQSYRAGFREGVKYGAPYFSNSNPISLGASFLRRLAIWMSVGMDVPNGVWAILGARKGFLYSKEHHINFDSISLINDYQWFKEYWSRYLYELGFSPSVSPFMSSFSIDLLDNKTLLNELETTLIDVEASYNSFPILNMTANESLSFKSEMNSHESKHNEVFDLLIDGGET